MVAFKGACLLLLEHGPGFGSGLRLVFGIEVPDKLADQLVAGITQLFAGLLIGIENLPLWADPVQRQSALINGGAEKLQSVCHLLALGDIHHKNENEAALPPEGGHDLHRPDAAILAPVPAL